MKSEGSLLCSQESTISPYPESDPFHTIPPHFPKIHFDIIFPSMPSLISGVYYHVKERIGAR